MILGGIPIPLRYVEMLDGVYSTIYSSGTDYAEGT